MLHPILSNRQRLGLYLIAWLVFGGLLAALIAWPTQEGWQGAAALAIPLALLYAFVCLSAWYPCRVNPVEETGVLSLIWIHVPAALLAGGFWVVLALGWSLVLTKAAPALRAADIFAASWVLILVVGTLLYLVAVILHYLLIAFETSRAADARALQLTALTREAELQAFKAQINPHFLFNSLNSIAALCGSDPAGARQMTIRLGDFLRTSLKMDSRDRIPLAEELELASSYLDIERVRFGERLRVDTRLEDDAGEGLVPALLMQPLIENALKHGIAHLVDGGTLSIEGRREGEQVVVLVTNPMDADSPSASGTGIGLPNVRGRLEILYGEKARLDIQQQPEAFEVRVSLPFDNGSRPE